MSELIYQMVLDFHSKSFFNEVILALWVIHVIATPCKLHKQTEKTETFSIPQKFPFF